MPEPEEIDPANDRPEEPVDHTFLNPTVEDIAEEDRETEREEREERGEPEPDHKPFETVTTKAGGPPPVDETDPQHQFPIEVSDVYHSPADLARPNIRTAEDPEGDAAEKDQAPLGAAGAKRRPENEASSIPGLHAARRFDRSSEET